MEGPLGDVFEAALKLCTLNLLGFEKLEAYQDLDTTIFCWIFICMGCAHTHGWQRDGLCAAFPPPPPMTIGSSLDLPFLSLRASSRYVYPWQRRAVVSTAHHDASASEGHAGSGQGVVCMRATVTQGE